MSIAIYVHFPFCLSICPYCDFDRQAHGFDRVDAYLDALLRELGGHAGRGAAVHSVFFGGGTPSLMHPAQVGRVLEAIDRGFRLPASVEVTLESNPGDADPAKLREFRVAGVTRISIGTQSLDDGMLLRLGRRHTADEARQALTWAHQAGFAVNLDFMYGLPGQSLEHWARTLDAAVRLAPEHLSCYLLTLEPHVPMGRDVAAGRLVLPDDDVIGEQYELTRARLAEAEYEQYEISNWARPGHPCRHNLTYWRDGEWLGVGAGAASSLGGRRWKNVPSVERYIRSVVEQGAARRIQDETLSRATALLDHVTLGLRLREGIAFERFRARFGIELMDALGQEAADLLEVGVLERDAEALRIGAAHQLLTNEVLVRLSPALEQAAALDPLAA
ncbi:MAG: radical SAM family heme chaperone HemW [Chloroflexi bacterium]|nr:radical SAM family heme chaperone HemW [Chloroflexota bacterium]